MPYPSHLLNEGEQIVLDLRPHWWYLTPRFAVLLGAIAAGLVVLAFELPAAVMLVAAAAVVGALVWFGARYVVWTTTGLTLTTDRLIYRAGVFTREGIEIPLERINTVFFRQSFFERVLRSGDLTLESAGEQGRQNFTDIRDPLRVQNEIYRQMEANENRKFDRAGAVAGSTPSADIPGQIRQLDELRRQGIISQQEFEAKKADLLRRM